MVLAIREQRGLERHLSARSGAGHATAGELQRLFFLQLRVVGSTMGTRDELADLLRFCEQSGIRPQIGAELPFEQAEQGLRTLLDGETAGKIVLTRS